METASAKVILDFEKPLAALEAQLEQLRSSSQTSGLDMHTEVDNLERKLEQIRAEVYAKLTPWQKVQLARHPQRPYALDYIGAIFTDFQELHGDRLYGDDGAIIGGTAWLDDTPVMLVAQQKGRSTKEKLRRNFGSPNPEGYRKALRLMQLAERFGLPLVCLIDTAGAYPGIGGEERHVAEAIAANLRYMSQLAVPSVGVILGEGGSGGALGIGLVDRLLVLQYAYYSVISPEGCAAILWKDRAYAPDAAEALQLTADKLLEHGIADGIIPEPLGGAHQDLPAAAQSLKAALQAALQALRDTPLPRLLDQRYAKYRHLGPYTQIPAQTA
jgi:acetyl-CoA carboxylase carboxyl transferase subunit alpha